MKFHPLTIGREMWAPEALEAYQEELPEGAQSSGEEG